MIKDSVKLSPGKSMNKGNMASNKSLSPGKILKDTIEHSPTQTNKYLPSRVNVNEILTSSIHITKTTVLNQLENNMMSLDNQMSKMDADKLNNRLKEMKSYHPPLTQIRVTDYKKRPMKKSDSDFLTYKEIFVEPKQKMLNELKEKEKTFEELFYKGAAKQYDKILEVHNEDLRPKVSADPNLGLLSPKKEDPQLSMAKHHQTLDISSRSLNLSELKGLKPLNSMSVEDLRMATIQASATGEGSPLNRMKEPVQNERSFFEQQIQVQPPDTPNYNTASPLTPGNGWAPSIPLIKNVDSSKTNVKDLLVRAKAGMQAGDVQKEAHLTFYLGMVHETNKCFRQAIKYYKKYFTCAQSMEDKIGMSLAMNRIGVNYFNDGKTEKSLEFHLKNQELSDRENSFASFYNLGITYRKLDRLGESLNSFNEALEWSREYKDVESECLCYGQLGITYHDLNQFSESFENFKDCYHLSVKLRNTKLQLDCLMNMSKISRYLTNSQEDALSIYQNAYECAKGLNDKKTVALCLCNMGVLNGNKQFEDYMKQFKPTLEDQ